MSTIRRVLQVEVDVADAELAADVLWLASPSAVSEDDVGAGRVRLTADVEGTVTSAMLPASSRIEVLEVDGEAYLDEWRTWAHPVRAGRHLVVHPAWLPVVDPDPADLILLIDPGRAFGSGAHATTRLVLATMERHLREGDRVLDVGTGSGVLAVAACRLGAAQVVAIDIDEAAVAATAGNARRNQVTQGLVVSTTPLEEVSGGYDLVLANIGASVLVDMAERLMACLAPSGALVLSGLLEDQADDVVARFGGLREVARTRLDGWVTSVLNPG